MVVERGGVGTGCGVMGNGDAAGMGEGVGVMASVVQARAFEKNRGLRSSKEQICGFD